MIWLQAICFLMWMLMSFLGLLDRSQDVDGLRSHLVAIVYFGLVLVIEVMR